ncbi:MAG: preprotein translocase subunit SecE [Planctomycetota bacterium]
MSDVSAPKKGYAEGKRVAAIQDGQRRGFFDIYKRGQGYNTRVWTATGMGVLVLWFAYFLHEKLLVVDMGTSTKLIQVGIPVAVILAFGLFGYWALAINHKICDFLIATEGEMKKVNWSTRKDIIGSTKVVVIVMLLMGALLFVVDLFFMFFFGAIGVLKTGGVLKMFGIE